MNNSLAISVENLSKTYRLGQIGTGTFTYDLAVWWAKMRGKPNPLVKIGDVDHGNRDGEELWALKDVSFTVEQGEVLGIIGRNGAGKSTLLKILSRVTAPTSGRIRVRGRVASLLEVGTGFHPELTGRENIYLNGAILGMTKQEVARKFDEIVNFAEVEKFIDTPVKRYSSGMYVRLAFAVAAHLEPEILVVDEVLAVGDAEFQKKCLGKMNDVAMEGRTVLFVSHNMSSVQALTTRCELLSAGQIEIQGPTQEVVEHYLSNVLNSHNYIVDELPRRGMVGTKMRIHQIVPCQPNNFGFYFGEPLVFDIKISSSIDRKDLSFGVTALDTNDTPILSAMSSKNISVLSLGVMQYRLVLENTRLAPGSYRLALSLFSGGLTEARTIHDLVNPAISFHIAPFNRDGQAIVDWQKSYGPIVHQHLSVSIISGDHDETVR